MTSVRGRRVLIVEDEYLLARDLTNYFQNLGAIVLGPAPSLEAASQEVEQADIAVLDVYLNGQAVFPIADELLRLGTPFVFYTGRDDIMIPLRFQHAARLSKPIIDCKIFEELFPPFTDDDPEEVSTNEILAVLPKLTLAALVLMEEIGPANRLLALTMTRALTPPCKKGEYASVEAWLTDLLDQTHRDCGRDLLL
ncbi:response regulator [Roseibium sp. LAB1]